MSSESSYHDAVPGWMAPADGFTAEEFLALRDLPRHTELIDGGLVLVAAQRNFHMAAIDFLAHELRRQSTTGLRVGHEMAVRLSARTVLEPDVLVLSGDRSGDPDSVIFEAADVLLAVEVESPDSVERDRDTKPHKYAGAGIEHYWRVAQDDGSMPVVHTYHRGAEGRYVRTGVHHDQLQLTQPFPITIDLAQLADYLL